MKPGIDQNTLVGPLFTEFNIVPVYKAGEDDSAVNATPDEEEHNKQEGSGVMDSTDNDKGNTIVTPPVIENDKGQPEQKPAEPDNGQTSDPNNNPHDNGTIDNNVDGTNEPAVTPEVTFD
ncbi:hypothetical protein UT300012_23220 [Paraclostridium bifermentans]